MEWRNSAHTQLTRKLNLLQYTVCWFDFRNKICERTRPSWHDSPLGTEMISAYVPQKSPRYSDYFAFHLWNITGILSEVVFLFIYSWWTHTWQLSMGQTGTKVASKIANSFTFSGSPSDDLTLDGATHSAVSSFRGKVTLIRPTLNHWLLNICTLQHRIIFHSRHPLGVLEKRLHVLWRGWGPRTWILWRSAAQEEGRKEENETSIKESRPSGRGEVQSALPACGLSNHFVLRLIIHKTICILLV